MNEHLNVTGVGIAVALAVIIAGALLFFGPSLFTFINPHTAPQNASAGTIPNTSPNTSMQEQSQNSQLSDISATDAPANVTELMGKDIVVGSGAEAKAGDMVTVNYVGMLTNGQVFDASANHGTTGFTFPLGAGQVIKGWDQGVAGMKVGGKRELIIPASLAYGAQSVGSIPANSTLIFEVELVNIQPGQAAQ